MHAASITEIAPAGVCSPPQAPEQPVAIRWTYNSDAPLEITLGITVPRYGQMEPGPETVWRIDRNLLWKILINDQEQGEGAIRGLSQRGQDDKGRTSYIRLIEHDPDTGQHCEALLVFDAAVPVRVLTRSTGRRTADVIAWREEQDRALVAMLGETA